MGVHAAFDPERFERNFVRGDWVFSRFGYQFDIYDPSVSEVIAAVPLSTRFDVQATVAAAKEAAPGWASLPGGSRVDHLLEAIERIHRNIGEVAALEARDTGAPVAHVLDSLSSALQELRRQFETRQAPDVAGSGSRPGAIGAILSWSSPFLVCCREFLPALAAGHTIVAKPSLQAPLSCSLFAEALREAKLPSGAFNLVQGTGIDAGAALAASPGLAEIWFQGSRAVAKSVRRAASATVARLRLCLRRPSLTLIGEGAELAPAVGGIIREALVNAARPGFGGIVVCAHPRLMDPLAEALQAALADVRYGSPVEETTSLGPMISDRARIERREAIAALQAKSAVSLYRAPEPDPRMARMGWFAVPEVLQVQTCDPVAIAETPLGPTILVRSAADAKSELNLDDWNEVRSFGTSPTAIAKELSDSLFSAG